VSPEALTRILTNIRAKNERMYGALISTIRAIADLVGV
jgi:hypothetical protein